MNPRDDWPPRLRKAMAHPTTERQGWSVKLAGALISAYLWVAYTDTLATTTLAVGGLAPTIAGAAIGGMLASVLLFLAPAMQGLRTRQPLMVVATSAFGIKGSALVPGLLIGLVQIVWFAVAVHYAVEFNLRGLLSVGLINPEDIRPGRQPDAIPQSTVYAATVMLWAVASALVATRFIRWIAALMIVYPIFMALALAGGMLWSLPGLPAYQEAANDLANASRLSPWPAFLEMSQLVFGFSAIVAAQAVNWGASLRGPSDVRRAAGVGVGLASTIMATLAVLMVAGAIGRDQLAPALTLVESDPAPLVAGDASGGSINAGALLPSPALSEQYTLGTVFEDRIGGIFGGLALIILGLGSLSSAVYAAYAYSNRLETLRKRPRRWVWGVVGAFVAYPLMVTGLAKNVPLVIDLTAGLVAPMLGVLTADFLRTRREWPGPVAGYRASGLFGWATGSAVGLLPVFARLGLGFEATRWLPLALIAYLIALLIVMVFEALRPAR